MFGAGFEDEIGGTDKAVKLGSFFKSDRTGAGNLAAHLAIDSGAGSGDGMQKLDARALLYTKLAAANRTADLATTANDQVSGAIDIRSECTEHGEVMTANSDAGNRASLADHHVTTRLDACVGMRGDLVVDEAGVAAALRALAGLGLGDGAELVAATEADDLTWRLGGAQQA